MEKSNRSSGHGLSSSYGRKRKKTGMEREMDKERKTNGEKEKVRIPAVASGKIGTK